MTYEETLRYLFSMLPMYQRVGKAAYKKDLGNTLELDKFYGHPHKDFLSVHIAGTNGKGSVSHFLASILQEQGYKTGLYTSPHLKDYRERIKINGVEIEKDFVVDFVESSKRIIEKVNPSFFELTVLMAFVYFKEKQTDIAVIETGMGGRLDSTNVIMPEVSVITNISFDHSEFLGDTLAKIAGEKAGIIKENTPVVIGEYHKETFPVFEQVAKSKKAPLILAEDKYRIDYLMEDPGKFLVMNVKNNKGELVYPELKSGLLGEYQRKNIITTLAAIDAFEVKGSIRVSKNAVYAGIKNVVSNTGIKGRWQIARYNPTVVYDIAHNEAAIRQLAKSVKDIPYRNLRIVAGFVNDKNLEKIVSLLPEDAFYYLTQAKIPRAKDVNELAEVFKANGRNVYKTIADVKEALAAALSDSTPDDLIIVTGSAFVVAEVV